MKGYKVFNSNWTCRGFQYKVGEVFEEDIKPECCVIGFHFCQDLKDCFNYYNFDPDNKIAEIEALGEISSSTEDTKCCTNKIKIVKELTWDEVLRLINTGKANTGIGNRGNNNSGNNNEGYFNSGSGNYYSRNSGNCNRGEYNSGYCNYGDWNSGNHNYGRHNSGNYNVGYNNSGYNNIGNSNTGFQNSGSDNSGSWNIGIGNSGDWNKTNYSSGCFNTESQKILMFNKPSNWTYEDWKSSKACEILGSYRRNVTEWISPFNMTVEDKKRFPSYKVNNGCLKTVKAKNLQDWWNELPEEDKSIVKSLPNFDPEIFKEITGIDVNL